MDVDWRVMNISGHIFINGNPIDGSLVNAGLASYINGDYSYSNFNKTTVSDLVKFYVKLSGSNNKNGALTDASFDDLVNHVLRISDINYPQRCVNDLNIFFIICS